ncbi:hypothetical protein ROHU_016768 [Labeo rohita]|uniref:Uncharacterized protein n=1 Tax=Labeo rohita TaxID=84645 RepID=A0A498NIH4_LABRO|nr:hypothetical protein ROHU_016768 [Labeo rohita]
MVWACAREGCERRRDRKAARAACFTPAGSACQNTSMSTNWVIFDMRTACQRIDGGVIEEPSACEAALAHDQSRRERRLQTIWHGPGTARHKSI